MPGRARIAAAGFVAIALVLSACSSNSTSSGGSTTPATSSSTAGATSSAAGSSGAGASSSATGGTESSGASGASSSATAASSGAATSGSSAAPTDLGLMTAGTLVVGMNLQFKPEMYLDDSGKPAGYDVDLLNELATSLGVKLEIQNLDFNGLIPGLQSKKFDLVSVGLNATDERKKVVDFSRAYVPYTSVLAIKTSDSSPATIDTWNKSGVTITALQGSTAEALAKKTFPSATVTGLPDQNAALLETVTGRSAGTVVEDYLLAQFNKANGNPLKAAAFPKALDLNYGAWAVQKGNAGLVSALNSFLCKAQSDGTLAKLYQKDFGVADFPQMPEGC
jgi:ABC-type amino acid transport substrate-binding protein